MFPPLVPLSTVRVFGIGKKKERERNIKARDRKEKGVDKYVSCSLISQIFKTHHRKSLKLMSKRTLRSNIWPNDMLQNSHGIFLAS